MGKKTLIIIIVAVVLGLLLSAGGIYFAMNKFNPEKVEEEKKKAEQIEEFDLKNGSRLTLEKVMVALNKTGSRQSYLTATFTIVFKDAKALEVATNMQEDIKDSILGVFEKYTAEELTVTGMREEMKKPVLEAIQNLFNTEEDREKIVAVKISGYMIS